MYVASSAESLAAAQAALDAAAAPAPPPPVEPLLQRLKPAAAERKWATAYCLAYAGGSTAAFAELARAAPEWLEIVGVEMPGKGELADAGWPADAAAAADGDADADDAEAAEAAEADEAAMMAALARRVAADAAGSVLVLVGWSMGGMLAAELALHLHAAGTPPQLVHVAGRMAPGSFVEAGADVDKYILATEEVKASAAWKEWLLPLLNADLRADARAERRVAAAWSAASSVGGMVATGAPPLQCRLQVCAGDRDVAFPPPAIDGWRALTSGGFEAHTVRGGHEILQRGAMGLLRLLVGALLPASPLYRVAWAPLDGPAGAGAAAVAPAAAAEPVTLVALDPSLDAAADGALLAALGGAHGLFVRVAAAADLEAQRAQCWALLRLVQRLAAAGGGGRLVLLCAAEVGAALAAGASKAVPLEFPELSVQRLHLPAAADLLRQSGPLGALPAVRQGWLSWLSAVASAHAHEADVWLAPEAPHAALAPRLLPQPRAKPSSTPTVDAAGTYLITGGSGGLGTALVSWLLQEQRVPPHQIVLLSRRAATPPVEGVRCVAADLGRPESLDASAALGAVTDVRGIFHLAGVLDDGLIVNMTEDRLAKVVAPKAGLLALLAYCARRRLAPQWVLAASSTSSLLGYAGQSNYCAANGLLDSAATFGAPAAADAGAPPPPRVLAVNFGPWGEVGMAREGTKAHQLSLRRVRSRWREWRRSPASRRRCAPSPTSRRPRRRPTRRRRRRRRRGRSAAASSLRWPRLSGGARRGPTTRSSTASCAACRRPPPTRPARRARPSTQRRPPPRARAAAATRARAAAAGSEDARARVEAFVQARLSAWEPAQTLVELGLDSLDLVQLRNNFQKAFACKVPLGVFTNATQTLESLLVKLSEKV